MNGFAVVELGVLGLVLVAAAIALIVWKGPRLLAFGGLLTGFGGVWTLLFGRVALTCGDGAVFPDATCMTEDLAPWVVGSASLVVAGVIVSVVAIRRARS
ncbi:MAG TPA: hypothetical protein VHR16_01900 [Candidatus Limnocylindrales bacterium]|nr:hypothetical protein [Candidatus Limnocylindrales bacterium]